LTDNVSEGYPNQRQFITLNTYINHLFCLAILIKPSVYDTARARNDSVPTWKVLPESWTVSGPMNCMTTPETQGTTNVTTAGECRPASQHFKRLAREYYDRALVGHRKALNSLTIDNVEAIFVTSVLLSFYSLFTLNESDAHSLVANRDAEGWLHLSRGTHYLCRKWREIVGISYLIHAGIFYGKIDMSDHDLLFHPENSHPFASLLSWAPASDVATPEEREVYFKVVSYLGFIYKAIREMDSAASSALEVSRLLLSMPSRCPVNFVDLVVSKRPRATVIFAHFFALMKLLSGRISWYQGIAEVQVPKLCRELPVDWLPQASWPLTVVAERTVLS
jgi:hypothetical protein